VIDVVPIKLPLANEAVSQWHRHHAPIPPGFPWYCVGAICENQLVGVAISGRPTNRNNDDGMTVEVLRVATNGTPHACSALLGAAARAAKAIGAARIITYTLEEESGSSLRGAGWVMEKTGIRSYWSDTKTRTPAITRDHFDSKKVRWAKHFKPRPKWGTPLFDSIAPEQGELFA
jgi:hypothetical protein